MPTPGEFIPLAEDSGLILPLGAWVLRSACAQARAWADRGLPVRVAVNLSPRQFRDPGLVDQVADILRTTGLDAGQLAIEITESTAMEQAEQSVRTMMALKGLGLGLAIDDFGTGYSSLSYLKSIPADSIKVDRSFVQDILSDPRDAAIVKTVIGLADTLGYTTIAEGIENEAIYAALRAEGCGYGQGYWFSRPLPADEFEALLVREPIFQAAVDD